jgi:hypothetical protein
MSVIPEPDAQAAEHGVLVWNGRIEELEGKQLRTPVQASPATPPELTDPPAAHSDP